TNNPLGRIGDTLDLSGLDVVSVTFDPTDPTFDPVTGVGESGTVVFNNAAGEPVTINFSEIENVIFDPLPDGVVDGEETSEEMGLGYDDSNDPTDGGGDQITNGDDVIDGNGGNDTINAGDGNDTVDGGIGNDIVNGAEGDDVVDGGAGDDLVTGGAGNDTVLGGDGDDELRGNEGNDLVDGGEGNDSMGGAEGDDTLLGGAGTDTLSGGSGDDVLDGGADDDTLNGDSGDDSITDLEGNNLIDAGTLGLPDRGFPIVGNADTDPTDDRDTVNTGAGNDTISTGDDADVIDAGDGNNVIDAGFDDDLITSGSGDDSIVSGEGSDTIEAGAGNDTIFGGVGPTVGDLVNLIDDNVVPLRDDPILDNGDDLIDAGDGDDLVFGEDDNDTILGGAGNDTLDGGIDDDVIEGGAGDDLVIGGQGADSLSGGLGNDTFTIGDFTDPIYGDTYKEGLGDTIFGGEDPDGNDVDVLDLSAAGPLRIDYDATDPTFDPASGVGESGTVTFFTDATQTTVAGTLSFAEIENVIPCFTPGTLIATPRGEVPVESLREGDRVITRDNGIQEIRWVGNRTLSRDELALNPSLKPILIKAGSLGQGLPERDMVVSPQHRLLIAGDRTQLYFDESEVLVAAKHLVNNGAIQTLETLRTTYIHFMFDRHEVVLSDGAWTESFQPGDQTLGAMGQAARDEIVALFPELATAEGVADYAAARRALKAHEAKLLQL
ncbi:Hint domain-containing protein, partial [Roseicyclus sp.]|uniref:Hint domain-containing protein n=1 Tax=Roseicyclus sp. TaxID=1914329 RepID=UPI003F69C04A